MAKKKSKPTKLLYVSILEAKPNPMFSESQRQAVRFLRYSRHYPCAECGKKARILWTALYAFRAMKMETFQMTPGEKVHPPLTPICQDHPFQPAYD